MYVHTPHMLIETNSYNIAICTYMYMCATLECVLCLHVYMYIHVIHWLIKLGLDKGRNSPYFGIPHLSLGGRKHEQSFY